MNVTLRDIREDDLENIIRWRSDPEITKFMNTDPVLTLEGQREWLLSMHDDLSKRHWLIEVDGEACGVIQLIDIDWKNKNVVGLLRRRTEAAVDEAGAVARNESV